MTDTVHETASIIISSGVAGALGGVSAIGEVAEAGELAGFRPNKKPWAR